jgi:DNA polymerase I-like protein with 3'-5' exonuclease and polymerase domains
VLSNDAAMKEAYASGDPYLAFAKQAKAVPPDATKQSHKKERDRYKNCSLGVQYGMREHSLARRIEQSPAHARELLDAHRRTYPDYWKWSDAAVDFAMLHGWTETVFGWRQQVGVDANPRSLQNFPAQANGAEMLRLAAVFSTERGVNVGGPIHDALLAEAAIEEIDAKVATARQGMADASRVILGGFELRTDVKVIRWPDRYVDERGEKMWEVVGALLERLKP